MTSTPATVDWNLLDYSDPAALLARLQPAYYRLIAGEADAEVEGTDRRRVRFQAGDAKRLEAVIAALEKKIAADPTATGRRARHALIGRF